MHLTAIAGREDIRVIGLLPRVRPNRSGLSESQARLAGAEVYRHTWASDIRRRPDGQWDIDCGEAGTITCEHFVNCGGLWAREVGRMCGLELPVLAMEHMYLLTDEVPESSMIIALSLLEPITAPRPPLAAFLQGSPNISVKDIEAARYLLSPAMPIEIMAAFLLSCFRNSSSLPPDIHLQRHTTSGKIHHNDPRYGKDQDQN